MIKSNIMPSILIVGASRGIGLGLANQFATAGYRVHATTRTPKTPGELGTIKGNIQIHGLEVRDSTQLEELVRNLGSENLDILIHNAGTYEATRDVLMEVNAEAPIRTCERLMERMNRGARVLLITSQLGARRGTKESLGDYGDSKAALNDRFRERAKDWSEKDISAVVMHPGWVRTDMGGENADISVDESVSSIFSFVEGMSSSDHGRFVTWEGSDHPW
jgi:NAD(P)-dependent dehydrogenase (short-subunit alcohol dehydrogenase family)